jgi:hypothetical protein
MEIEDSVRAAATAFRDNNAEALIDVAVRLWWTSRLRGRWFAELLQQARDLTQDRISLGAVQCGEPGRREAMPYFFAVLRNLAEHDRSGLMVVINNHSGYGYSISEATRVAAKGGDDPLRIHGALGCSPWGSDTFAEVL